MKIYIEVKIHAATDTKGKRISCQAKEQSRKYFPWDHKLNPHENLRVAAESYCQVLLAARGYAIDNIPPLREYESVKTGLPIGYVWE
jgi:hypothetical protein